MLLRLVPGRRGCAEHPDGGVRLSPDDPYLCCGRGPAHRGCVRVDHRFDGRRTHRITRGGWIDDHGLSHATMRDLAIHDAFPPEKHVVCVITHDREGAVNAAQAAVWASDAIWWRNAPVPGENYYQVMGDTSYVVWRAFDDQQDPAAVLPGYPAPGAEYGGGGGP